MSNRTFEFGERVAVKAARFAEGADAPHECLRPGFVAHVRDGAVTIAHDDGEIHTYPPDMVQLYRRTDAAQFTISVRHMVEKFLDFVSRAREAGELDALVDRYPELGMVGHMQSHILHDLLRVGAFGIEPIHEKRAQIALQGILDGIEVYEAVSPPPYGATEIPSLVGLIRTVKDRAQEGLGQPSSLLREIMARAEKGDRT